MSSSELHRPFNKYLALRDFAAPRTASICSLGYLLTIPIVEKQFRKGSPPRTLLGRHRASRSDSENVRRGPKRAPPWQTPQIQYRGSKSRKIPKKGVFEQPKATFSLAYHENR